MTEWLSGKRGEWSWWFGCRGGEGSGRGGCKVRRERGLDMVGVKEECSDGYAIGRTGFEGLRGDSVW